MRVGINLLYLLPGVVGGTQTYAAGLLDGLAQLDTDDEFILYTNRECADFPLPDSPRFKRVLCPVNAVRREARYAWEQLMLPLSARRDRLDVLHSLGYVGPVYTPCPHVVSIHDMNYLDIPESVQGTRLKALTQLVQRAASRAAMIVTMSEFSRRRIIHHLHVDPARVIAIHLAGRADAGGGDDTSIPAQYGITRPYIVAFSSPFPHKNIPRLIQAFATLAARIDHALVLVGHLPPDGAIASAVQRANLGSRVVFTGYVPDHDVMPLIRNADLFAFPSLYEGFGLPLLDAQQAGVPVVASDAASIPEVGGLGASYFDALNPEAMAATIAATLSDKGEAERLKELGRLNIRRFSWVQTASSTLGVYGSVSPK